MIKVKFERELTITPENHEESDAFLNPVVVFVERYGEDVDTTTVSFEYHTSDITALGMPLDKVTECQLALSEERGAMNCGDYSQKSGIITFYPTEIRKEIIIDIVNDDCYEKYEEYILVQLSLPGGKPLLGKDYVTRIRIDDDDVGLDVCANNSFVSKDSIFQAHEAKRSSVGERVVPAFARKPSAFEQWMGERL